MIYFGEEIPLPQAEHVIASREDGVLYRVEPVTVWDNYQPSLTHFVFYEQNLSKKMPQNRA